MDNFFNGKFVISPTLTAKTIKIKRDLTDYIDGNFANIGISSTLAAYLQSNFGRKIL